MGHRIDRTARLYSVHSVVDWSLREELRTSSQFRAIPEGHARSAPLRLKKWGSSAPGHRNHWLCAIARTGEGGTTRVCREFITLLGGAASAGDLTGDFSTPPPLDR
jgi:hypothetical protein